jgi:tetratricopeptide (TPR) repeat protein
MAYAATNRLEAAERERDLLVALVADPALEGQTTFSTNSGKAILRIAPEVVAGEIAARRRQWDAAVLHLDRAVRYEDALIYQEPPDWHAPVRQNLAAVLLAAGRPDEAEAVYWEDLKKYPENGWSLFGLAQALKAQGKAAEAALVEARFRKAWQDADITLSDTAPGSLDSRHEGRAGSGARQEASW